MTEKFKNPQEPLNVAEIPINYKSNKTEIIMRKNPWFKFLRSSRPAFRKMNIAAVTVLAVLSFTTATPVTARSMQPGIQPASLPASTTIQHVFVVVMENHSYNEVWNTSSAPYITSLGNTYARTTNYHAITHPSLPNYLDLFGGSNYGITTDCNPSSSCHASAVNLADNLEARGLTWKGYMESMPSPCSLTSSGNYIPHHNPFVYFDDIRNNPARCNSHVVPFTDLASDLASAATTPNYAMISPNECNDMHSCSISTGDTWLKNNLPAILNSPACTSDLCLVILTWDEDNRQQSNQVLTIFAGSGAETGGATSARSYTHFSLLRTIENIFGLPTQTGNDATASPITFGPPATTLSSPSGDIATNYNPTYTWNDVSNATWYLLQVNTNTPNKAVIYQWYTAAQANCNGTTCSVTPATTLTGGGYTWWVLTYNSGGDGAWSTGMNFSTTVIPKLGAATLVSPTGSIGTILNPTYTWNQVTGSTWYLLQVNTNTPNKAVIYQWYTSAQVGCNGTTCSVTPSTTLAGGGYTWWVLTYSTTDGTWSSGMNFTVGP